MTDNSPQLEMLGKQGVTVSVELQDEVARGCRDRQHALVKCYEVSNLHAKQVYGPLKIDQGVFSRILGGSAFLDPNLKFQWMALCGNIIPVRFDALQLGHELKPIRTDLERRVTELEAENNDLRRAMNLVVDMVRGR